MPRYREYRGIIIQQTLDMLIMAAQNWPTCFPSFPARSKWDSEFPRKVLENGSSMRRLLLLTLVLLFGVAAKPISSSAQQSSHSNAAKSNKLAQPAEDPATQAIAALVFVLLLFAIGYGIYSKILRQMAINAKNKRIIKNEVTYWTGREYRRSARTRR